MNRRASHSRLEATADPEKLGRGLWASVALHVALAVLLVASPWLFPAYGDVSWGSEAGGAGGISVQVVANMSGVPLPTPAVANPDAAGNDSAGFYEPLPPEPAAAPEAAPADAVPVPETFGIAEAADEPEREPVSPTPAREPETPPRPEAPPRPTPTPREDRAEVPDNAVPFGEGGPSAISTGFSLGGGTGGLDGAGAFGEQHGTYVTAIIRRISSHWVQGTIDARIRNAPRVYVGFDILRDGRIDNIRVVESSGHQDIDRSAERAVHASNPLSALPPGFRGQRVSIRFWFELDR